MKTLHPKVKELQLRALPVNYSSQSTASNELEITDRRVKMYLAVWGVKDDAGTIMLKGCCSKSIQERGPKSQSKYKITFLNFHDQKDPLGVFDVLEEDDYGLYAECQIDNVPELDRTLEQIRSGTLNQFSIGFRIIWDKAEYNEDLDAVVLKEIDLYEGSVVTIASNAETYAVRAGSTLEQEQESLIEETERIIMSLPRNKQLEIRQLITKHISLSKVEPQTKKLDALRGAEPKERRVQLLKYVSQNI